MRGLCQYALLLASAIGHSAAQIPGVNGAKGAKGSGITPKAGVPQPGPQPPQLGPAKESAPTSPLILSTSCKPVPGSAGWPSDADFAALNVAVKGRLLKPAPPAAACYRGVNAAGAPTCAAVTVGWHTAEFHLNHPTSTMWQSFTNHTCPPSGKGGSCTNGGYPVYVVAAKEPADVKAAVDFARTRNIRLNIKGTGHDFLGRSVQPNSLSIWTRGMRGMKWFDSSFTPKGCLRPINGPAVTVASGHIWGEVYDGAKARRVSVVGGYSSTVGVGGFTANGGHGKMSAKYGYAADMVLEIELVNAAGEYITANECQNQEYFWAMRGGGGSTYGVVLTYTYQAVPGTTLARYIG